MPLPSSTAFTIDAKLSSVSTISEASLATSVPVIPIATPISEFFKAGASFTPSPVIATTWPLFFKAFKILTLCSGLTLAHITILSTILSSSSSLNLSNSSPLKALSPSLNNPNSFVIAIAVSLWSPVITTVLMPADLHFIIDSLTSSLGGSIIACKPIKIKFFSTISDFGVYFSANDLYANPKTLKALLAIL